MHSKRGVKWWPHRAERRIECVTAMSPANLFPTSVHTPMKTELTIGEMALSGEIPPVLKGPFCAQFEPHDAAPVRDGSATSKQAKEGDRQCHRDSHPTSRRRSRRDVG